AAASGLQAWIAASSCSPPVTCDFRSATGIVRFCAACSIAAHSSVVLIPSQACFCDMPCGSNADRCRSCPAAFGAIELDGLVAVELPEIGCCMVVIDGSSRDGGAGVSSDCGR